nr:vinorine synthase-like [Ipomoea trifida]
MKLTIVSKELIKPSIPTPPENLGYNLSFLDEPTPHFYIPLVLYYHNHTHTNQSEILSRLKSSLSKTLTKFYPLAGRNKGQTLVSCNDEGVCFVVVRGEGMIEEVIGSAEGKESEKLVPYGKGDGIVAKTEELLGVQVSLFSCGGVAIGVCISHRVADVCSLCVFLQGWAACACGDEIKPPVKRLTETPLRESTRKKMGMQRRRSCPVRSLNWVCQVGEALEGRLGLIVKSVREVLGSLRHAKEKLQNQMEKLVSNLWSFTAINSLQKLTGVWLSHLQNLTDLTVSHVSITAIGPSIIVNSIKNLITVTVSHTNLTGFLPKHWHPNLSYVDLFGNKLKGRIPPMLNEQENLVSPVFNGSSLFPARGTPDFKPPESCSALQPPPEPLATKRFVFSASAIDEMKAKHTKTTNTNTTPASRVEVVSALLWKRCMASKEHKNGAVSANMFPVNLRRRMAPPLPEYSFGNLYQTASAVADGEEDWPGLVKKLRAASERIDSSYVTELRGENGFQVLKENFRQIGRLMAERNVVVFRFTSWCGFPVYEMDFGWGNPGWVSTPGFGSIDTVILLDSRYPGGVEAWVTMADQDMSRLEQDRELHSFTC